MFLIRNMLEKDLDHCVDIISQTLGDINGRHSREDFFEFLYPGFNYYRWMNYFVAETSGTVVGVCGIYSMKNHPKKIAVVRWFAVYNSHQHQGIGSKLFLECQKLAIEKKCERIFTWSTPYSESFYMRFGMHHSNVKIRPEESKILLAKTF